MRAPCTRYQEENGKTRLEITLRNLEQLFDTRDPSPFRERDLDQHAVEYIVASADEVSRKAPLELFIYLSDGSPSSEQRSYITDAVHTFFGREADLLKRRKGQILMKGRRFLLFGFAMLLVLLGLAELVSSVIASQTLRSVVREGLAITGWVAMWRPLEVILYDWQPIEAQRKLYEKLSEMRVSILSKSLESGRL
jgi:hypothetical protein